MRLFLVAIALLSGCEEHCEWSTASLPSSAITVTGSLRTAETEFIFDNQPFEHVASSSASLRAVLANPGAVIAISIAALPQVAGSLEVDAQLTLPGPDFVYPQAALELEGIVVDSERNPTDSYTQGELVQAVTAAGVLTTSGSENETSWDLTVEFAIEEELRERCFDCGFEGCDF